MPFLDVTSFTASDVDMLVDFLDGVQHEFGSKPRRDGVVSFQASTTHNAPMEEIVAVIVVSRSWRIVSQKNHSCVTVLGTASVASLELL